MSNPTSLTPPNNTDTDADADADADADSDSGNDWHGGAESDFVESYDDGKGNDNDDEDDHEDDIIISTTNSFGDAARNASCHSIFSIFSASENDVEHGHGHGGGSGNDDGVGGGGGDGGSYGDGDDTGEENDDEESVEKRDHVDLEVGMATEKQEEHAEGSPSRRRVEGLTTTTTMRDRGGVADQQDPIMIQSMANVDDTNVERVQDVKIRNQTAAMRPLERFVRRIAWFLSCGICHLKDDYGKKDDDVGECDKLQYTVKQKKRQVYRDMSPIGLLLRCVRGVLCFGQNKNMFDVSSGYGGGAFSKLGRTLYGFWHWMFLASFLAFFVYVAVFFYALVILFAGLYIAAGNARPDCILVGGETFGHAGTLFSDAFSLSWHTFSTVGYGAVYPALSNPVNQRSGCSAISLICVVESFVGILYGALVGSILFGKVSRIQSRAQVVFSDPLIVRYGSGVVQDVVIGVGDDDDDEDGKDDDDEVDEGRRLCPILEFRIANRLHDEIGGEILDAAVTVVACHDADEANPEVRKHEEMTAKKILSSLVRHSTLVDKSYHTSVSSAQGSDATVDPERGNTSVIGCSLIPTSSAVHTSRMRGLANAAPPHSSSSGVNGVGRPNILSFRAWSSRFSNRQEVEEDPTNRFAPRRVFSGVAIESPEHPFFKRVWRVTHVLDETSPLLSADTRKRIRKNGGRWPAALNNARRVRECLQFNQLLVSLNGISNVSGSSVYAHKIYDRVDLAVGYQFVNILYHSNDLNVKVDLDLVNDVREQHGGGGEDLLNRSD